MACGVDNNLGKIAFKAGTGTVDFSSGATRLDFTSESINAAGSLIESASIAGTRSKLVNHVRRGPYNVAGSINFDASPLMVRQWAWYALGANSLGVCTPTESLPVFGLMIDKVSDVMKVEDCKVTRLVLRGSAGQLISGTVDIVGRNYSNATLTFPSLDLGTTADDYPLAFSDLALEIGATAYEFNSFELTIDNAIEVKQRNALYAACLRESQRSVNLNVDLPSTGAAWAALDEPDLAGIVAEIVMTSTVSGAGVVTVDLPVCQKARSLPAVSNKGEQNWPITLQAKADPGDDEDNEITITVATL